MARRRTRTAVPGISKTRKGSPPIGLQTLIDRTKRAAFVDEILKTAENPFLVRPNLKEEMQGSNVDRALLGAQLASSAATATGALSDLWRMSKGRPTTRLNRDLMVGGYMVGAPTAVARYYRTKERNRSKTAAAPGPSAPKPVDPEEALEAAKYLSKKRGPREHIESGAVSAAINPVIQATAKATKAAIDAKKGRWGAAKQSLKGITKGDVASQAVSGGLFGAGISAGREGLRLQKARDTYEDFLKQHGTPAPGTPG